MHLIRRISRTILYTLLFFISLCIVYCAASFVLSRIGVAAEQENSNDITVYLLDNGVHVDIAMPVKTSVIDWSTLFMYSHTARANAACPYVAVGWGDRGFYVETPEWKDLKFSTAFNAVFGLGKSAVRIWYAGGYFVEDENCIALKMSYEQYRRLVDYIKETLVFDNEARILQVPKANSYGNYDAFYQANGHYSLFRTCNTWANDALKRCGQRACLWTAFSGGIFHQYKNVKPERL